MSYESLTKIYIARVFVVDQQGMYIYFFFHTKLPNIINEKVQRPIDNLANHQIICYLQSSRKPKE